VGLGRCLQTIDTLRLTYGQRPRQLALAAMSLMANGGEPGESSDTDSPAEAEAEPEAEADDPVEFRIKSKEPAQSDQSDQGYYVEQYVLGVLDYSSQYGIDYSISYTAANLIGRPAKYPEYGDYPETFPMVSPPGPCRTNCSGFLFNSRPQRTYGDWWQRAPSATREIQPQNLSKLPTQDYVGKVTVRLFLKKLR